MINKELLEKIARLETELAEVKEMAEAMKKKADGSGVFKPKDRQIYWFISSVGNVIESNWVDTYAGEYRYAIGDCFPTEQSARDTVRALKLIQKARESQNGFVPDWEDSTQRKYILYFEDNGIWVGNNISRNLAPTLGYWGDKSECNEYMDENHDELLWFFTEYRR